MTDQETTMLDAPPAPGGRTSRAGLDALASAWALLGVAAAFAWPVYRLGVHGFEAIAGGLDAVEWTGLVLLTAAFVYGEGVRALDRRWVPSMIERVRALRDEGGLLKLLGPLYGLGLVGRDRWQVTKHWVGVFLIVLAVLIIRAMPSPWRGIVDFAVGAALAWGLIAIMRRVPTAVR